MSDSYLYIRIVSSIPSLFHNVQKNLPFINNNILTQTQSQLFLEDIAGGLLYVYKNFELFSLLNQPLSVPTLKKLQMSDLQGANLFFNQIMTAAKFPTDGIVLTFTVSGIYVEKGLELYLTYFQSYQDRTILPKRTDSETIEVHFTQFLGLQLYAQRLSRFLADFM